MMALLLGVQKLLLGARAGELDLARPPMSQPTVALRSLLAVGIGAVLAAGVDSGENFGVALLAG